ncbi:DNA polymerase I [Ostreibacterium oceani]|uniref:DNA polymerase I n=1 Tax=Ostreibacterium oceani TaxID=2654998 RepID=A0A6N7EXZ7_9GAMM|nr:DNA polymerase I [Ostreibacterium oceani]MPV86455.1 DNA polymerase I [Ostreibacterium oceani]
MSDNHLLILVDGSSYLFRAFHGLPKLTSRNGEPTGAIKGVISMIQKLYDEYQPSHIGIVFDAPGKTFRHEMYEAYKSHRPPIDEDLRCQIKPLLSLIESMGYPLIQITGVEADDVIGTLAKQAVESNMQVLISTGDKDLAQLIDGNTRLIDTMKMKITDYQNVAERFKVDALRADQVVDFLALVGDSADNIPGIPKVGPKTAAKWLSEYHDIAGVIANQDRITGKIGENLRQHIDQLALSKSLTQIKLDVPLPDVDIEKLSMNAIDTEAFSALCKRFDLTQLLTKVLGSEANNQYIDNSGDTDAKPIETHYELVTTQAAFQALSNTLMQSLRFTFEVLSTSTAITETELIGVSFSTELGKAYYLPLRKPLAPDTQDTNTQDTEGNTTKIPSDNPPALDILPLVDVLPTLKAIFGNAAQKLTFDSKMARHTLARYGISIENLTDDIMIAGYVFNSTANKHLLADAVEKHLQYKLTDSETLLGKGVKAVLLSHIDLDKARLYTCERVDFINRLANYLLMRVNAMPGLNRVYHDIEMPFIQALQRTEANGILIDTALLSQQSQAMQIKIDALEKRAYELADETFNINSPKQLQQILFDKLGLPVVKKTPKGQPSTDESVLHELAKNHELPQIILENRGLTKLKTTYTDKLPEVIQPATGRIHTTYHQAVTSTGRLSSAEPNLQNIPIRSAEGRKIRQAFIAPPGYCIMASDYSQIELRIMAHLSQDSRLLAAFSQNKDIHTQTAAEIFELPEDEVSADERRKAKAINFGLIYGMSAFGLAKQIDVSRSEAGQYIENYFDKYPGVKTYMTQIADFAQQLGYVETIFGRRLYIPDITSKNVIRRNAAERLSINAPMQGSAADIIKIAMTQVHQQIADNKGIRLIMQVHDELVFEVEESQIDAAKSLITQTMENAVALSVPLVVDTGLGANWDEAH